MPDLPSGTVTFLFTDIAGSTALWERDRPAMAAAVARHIVLLDAAIQAHGGVQYKTIGDAVQAAFPTAPNAVAAGVAAQRALQAEPWPDPPGPLHVRIALHAGEASPDARGDYLAAPLNRLARLLAAGHGTQIVLTEVVERLVEGALPDGVSLRPLGTHRLRDLQEPDEVFQVVAPGLPDQFPPLQSLPRHPTNLGTPPTALFGREPEIAAVLRLLGSAGARLVTLTGPGGTGKTRLAQEIGAEALDRFPDGVFFVDLSALTDPALVVLTIAATLGVREIPGQPFLTTLANHLTPKQLLLLLDNYEQVLDSAPDTSALLASCPGLVIIVTSREPLRVRGEREFPVLPLPLPAADHLPPVAELAQVPAVALFVERASATQPDFVLSADNAAAVVGIGRRLDGLPLAIELAAARINVLPPTALLARLEQRLPVLTGGGRDLPARQRTMRNAIAWSYELLAPDEQDLFRRLAVFAGGLTLEAAEAVALPGAALPVLDGVVALVEQSLLRQMPSSDAEPRYQMLETVREFGLERLAAAGEEDAVRERHARHLLTLAERRVRGMQLFMDLESITRMAPEQDNIRLALAWFDDHDEIDAMLGLGSLLYGLCLVHGLYREGLRWLERALERSSQTPSRSRVQALVAAGMLALFQGDYARAATFSPEAVVLAQEFDDPLLVGQALTIAGFLAYRLGEYGRAEDLLNDGYRRLSQLGNRMPGARADTGFALLILGSTALVQEQFDRAERWNEAGLELFQEVGNDWGIGETQASLGAGSYCTGNHGQAAARYAASLERARTLHGLAGVAAESGWPEAGARLLGAAEGLALALGAPAYPRDQPVRARALAALTAALGEERLEAGREAGRALTLEAAIAEAEAVAETVI
ncbi:MAG: adenylate/guanylate cyclase protein [Thermomicrobiales bacterium]|nr:adenylate/guanylate cyclase protein [Thermomicrobiales bacterium]